MHPFRLFWRRSWDEIKDLFWGSLVLLLLALVIFTVYVVFLPFWYGPSPQEENSIQTDRPVVWETIDSSNVPPAFAEVRSEINGDVWPLSPLANAALGHYRKDYRPQREFVALLSSAFPSGEMKGMRISLKSSCEKDLLFHFYVLDDAGDRYLVIQELKPGPNVVPWIDPATTTNKECRLLVLLFPLTRAGDELIDRGDAANCLVLTRER